MARITSVLVTGANVGLGYDCARQLALKEGMKKVILGCRNPAKAQAAKTSLEQVTGKRGMFEILIIDVSNLDSVRKAVDELNEPINGLIMNAGGFGGRDLAKMSEYAVPVIVSTNILGHVLLVDLLLEQKKLTGTAIYSGSEAARGHEQMGFKKYEFKDGSVDEFTSLLNGSGYPKKTIESMYGVTKLIAALWMSSMARKDPSIRFITMSPGGTTGTTFARDMPAAQRFIMMKIIFPILKAFKQAHSLEVGAKRYVDALMDEDHYKSGVFYASKKGATGPTVDQVIYCDYLAYEAYQDNANTAIHKFINVGAVGA